MLADTEAIRALGSANSTHAADLAAIAAALSSVPETSASSTLGPVGARFLSALGQAATDGSRALAALSDRLTASNTTSYNAAAAYDDADHGAGTRIAGV